MERSTILMHIFNNCLMFIPTSTLWWLGIYPILQFKTRAHVTAFGIQSEAMNRTLMEFHSFCGGFLPMHFQIIWRIPRAFALRDLEYFNAKREEGAGFSAKRWQIWNSEFPYSREPGLHFAALNVIGERRLALASYSIVLLFTLLTN